MICIRCGDAGATENPVILALGNDSEFIQVFDSALRARGIAGRSGLSRLCDHCWQVAKEALEAAGRAHAAAHRDSVVAQYETNIGRPLTSEERTMIDTYLDGATNPGAPSGS
jgi:hypothetical protein